MRTEGWERTSRPGCTKRRQRRRRWWRRRIALLVTRDCGDRTLQQMIRLHLQLSTKLLECMADVFCPLAQSRSRGMDKRRQARAGRLTPLLPPVTKHTTALLDFLTCAMDAARKFGHRNCVQSDRDEHLLSLSGCGSHCNSSFFNYAKPAECSRQHCGISLKNAQRQRAVHLKDNGIPRILDMLKQTMKPHIRYSHPIDGSNVVALPYRITLILGIRCLQCTDVDVAPLIAFQYQAEFPF
mmetsp:Transcript_26573/g.85875  ORF Transcript_26573/g.85875 Transcript_26573/m.85875 type:complete len:240 (-) Transcript_26573:564-1283(-)